jgi:hypothetical protein
MTPTLGRHPGPLLVPSKTLTPTFCYSSVCAVLFAFTTVVFFFFAPAEHDIGIDFWEHVASVKQLMADPIRPLHPQYATHDPSREYMPWYLLLAILGRVFGWDPLGVMAVGAMLTTALCLVAIGLFFREYFKNNWAPLAGLTCLFFLWGKPWVWSSFYNFRSYLTTAAYPSSFAFGLTFIIWWVGGRAMRCSSLRGWEPPALTLLVALALLVHQLSGLFAVVGLICFLVVDTSGQWRRKVVLTLLTALGMAVIAAWPYFNPWQMASKDQVWNPLWVPVESARFYRPLEVLACIGPALAGVIAFVIFIRTKVHLAVVLGFIGALFAYTIGGFLGNPMTHRILMVVILYLHVGLTWLLLTIFAGSDGPRVFRRRAVMVILVTIVVAHLGVVCLELADIAFPQSIFERVSIHQHSDVVGSFRTIGSYLSPNSITMAAPGVCKALPAFQGRVVSVYWTSPLVRDDQQRGWDSERFFSPETSASERRDIIVRYGVTHILYEVKKLPPDLGPMLHKIADEKITVNGIILMKIKS